MWIYMKQIILLKVQMRKEQDMLESQRATALNWNEAEIVGKVAKINLHHHFCGTIDFDELRVCTNRSSGKSDYIQVLISHDLLPLGLAEGDKVWMKGKLRCYPYAYKKRVHTEQEEFSKNFLFFSCKEIEIVGEDEQDVNIMNLQGALYKKENLRITTDGKEIIDFILSVKRKTGKYDYIPCTAWGKNAEVINQIDKWTNIDLNGKLQNKSKYIYNSRNGIEQEMKLCKVAVMLLIKVGDYRSKRFK